MKKILSSLIYLLIFVNCIAQESIKIDGETYPLQIITQTIETSVLVKEKFPVKVNITCLSSIKKEDVTKIHENLGYKHSLSVREDIVESAVRAVFGQHSIEELITKGRKIAEIETERIINEKFTNYHIQLHNLLITNIELSERIRMVYENKFIAEQEKQKQFYVLEKTQKEMEIQKLKAKGMAEYNQILDSSLTTKILQLKYIEALQKIAESENTKVIIVGGKDIVLPKLLESE